jgi:ABC-type branched-subunit amino acid transport system ATPase component
MGTVIAPLLVAVLSAGFGLTWRGVFLVSGLVALTAAVFSLRLRDPGYGTWDAARVRRAVQEETGRGDGVQADDDVQLGFFENVHRLFLIPTVRRLLAVYAVLGMLVIPLYTYLFFFLDERWAMGPAQRGVFLAVMAVFAIGGVALFAKRGEELYRSDMSRLAVAGSSVLGGGIVALAIALFIPSFPLMVAFFGVAFALFAVVNPLLSALLLSIVRPRMRPHAAALTGIFLAGVGGLLGLLLLGGIDRRFGTTGAILSIALPGLVAALVLRTVAKTVDRDFDRMVDELVEEEEVRGIVAAGQHLPLVACRGLDFHYGSVQVLFHIDFTVDDGEMVALLGTNGAGKSTLLRAISGLGLPTAGTIRLRGSDITYVDTIRRRQLGIAQVPGGRAVFGPLSVVENLRLFGYTFGRDKKALDLAIDESFAAFPALAARRNQAAATLSGGEQQMLGLCQALVLRPQLLLIDELSLGLAPKIVGELLDMLKRINVAGAAVVLVEQSVNIALSVVEHVYFMEKGEIRFDGRARDLLGERDLLRSVFLEGAAKGLAR